MKYRCCGLSLPILLVVAVLSLTPVLGTAPGYQAVWLDADGTRLPFQSEAELERFLLNAKVLSSQPVGEGMNKTRRLLLELDGVRMHAAFRYVKVDLQLPDPRHESFLLNHRDDSVFEVAAYRLSKLLGLDMVPPTVIREVNGQKGTLQVWVENALMEKERRTRGIKPPDEWYWMSQMFNMRFFDNLVANTDRHQGNLLIDPSWKAWLIDHTQAFRRYSYLHDPARLLYFDRRVWTNLLKLDKQRLKAELSDVLRKPELNALIKRRNALVKHIKKLIAKKGDEIFFSLE